jgi:peptidoglycan/xylan/chitin deacetylase (PgdA/CDA1 family)
MSNIPVLTYHKVTNQKEFGITTVSPDRFERQINTILESGFVPITFKGLLNNPSLPEKPIIITFDDGYQCIYKNVLPVLDKYNAKAVVFVISNYIGKENSWEPLPFQRKFKHLNNQQVVDLHKNGFEIASHSVNHLFLPLYNIDTIKKEIYSSKIILEEIINDEVLCFAYPYGFFNENIMKVVSKAGYRFAVSNFYYGKLKKNYRLLAMKRHSIYSLDNDYFFKKKLITISLESKFVNLTEWLLQKGSIAGITLNLIKNNAYFYCK